MYHLTVFHSKQHDICGAAGYDVDFASEEQHDEVTKLACKKYLACLFVQMTDGF